ncbi:MAG TPA: hypothetical protein DIW47_15015 [Bacteroidetes bacterium]|nr:hypothetical protein [Bacteroidota bacterium]
MKKSAYGKPFLVSNSNEITLLNKVDLADEASIQELIFNNPECLPVSDIDESFNPLVPVCMELNTQVGPMDILMTSPNGELVIIETKLWRNPEARRKVVAQILDYAKELSSWSYEDLQRELNKRLSTKGNILYDVVKRAKPDLVLSEADFVDSVSRSLERGRFLLLIAGDGIREGAAGIAEFLSSAGFMNFTFAMIEFNVYQAEGIGRLIIPKTLAKTTEISRMTIDVPKGFVLSKSDEIETSLSEKSVLSPDQEREKHFYTKFWQELLAELMFDDPGQALPNPANAQNLYVYPGTTKRAWISAYFAKSQKRVGVYFRVARNQEGLELLEALSLEKDAIRSEFADEATWNWSDVGDISVRFPCDDVFADENREALKDFFKNWLNTFVNVFRPRMKRLGM